MQHLGQHSRPASSWPCSRHERRWQPPGARTARRFLSQYHPWLITDGGCALLPWAGPVTECLDFIGLQPIKQWAGAWCGLKELVTHPSGWPPETRGQGDAASSPRDAVAITVCQDEPFANVHFRCSKRVVSHLAGVVGTCWRKLVFCARGAFCYKKASLSPGT